MDKLGDLVSGLVPARELLQVPLQDTWLETEEAAHELPLTDLTAVVGVAAQARVLLHHPHRDTRAPGLARRAVDKLPSEGFF